MDQTAETADLKRRLSESETRHRLLIGEWARAGWETDAEGAVVADSPSWRADTGQTVDEWLGEGWLDAIHPDDRAFAERQWREAMAAGRVLDAEFRLRTTEAGWRWTNVRAAPLRDAQGHIAKWAGLNIDIDARKRAAMALRSSEGRLRALFESIDEGCSEMQVILDEEGHVVDWLHLALNGDFSRVTASPTSPGASRATFFRAWRESGSGGWTSPIAPANHSASKPSWRSWVAGSTMTSSAWAAKTVRWASMDERGQPWLALDWIEEGAPLREPSTRRGVGSALIEGLIPYELNGQGTITLRAEGGRCHLEFPLQGGDSSLETDAPQPTAVFGGTLDMAGAPDLTGRKVLVVEDDSVMACDTAAALRGAGAEGLGPCPNDKAARKLLDDEAPTHAVLDLSLGGGGPRDGIANLPKARGVPFLVLTGYDPDVMPPELQDVVRLQKPLPFRDIIAAVGQLQAAQGLPRSRHS